MNSLPVISIIGAGNVGSAFAQLFANAGYEVVIGARNEREARGKTNQLRLTHPSEIKVCDPKAAAANGDIVLLTVTDNIIERVCEQLASHFSTTTTVVHCSGALDSSALLSAQQQGCNIASAHPLNSFPDLASAVKIFSSNTHASYLYLESEKPEMLSELFQHIGFQTVSIERAAKPLYHAACVFACNYLTALMELSLQTADAAGLTRETFWQSIQPLIQTTLNNITEHGTAHALSGPIARGDSTLVNHHLAVLEQTSKALKTSYRDLGRHALSLAITKGELDDTDIKTLQKVLGKLS